MVLHQNHAHWVEIDRVAGPCPADLGATIKHSETPNIRVFVDRHASDDAPNFRSAERQLQLRRYLAAWLRHDGVYDDRILHLIVVNAPGGRKGKPRGRRHNYERSDNNLIRRDRRGPAARACEVGKISKHIPVKGTSLRA